MMDDDQQKSAPISLEEPERIDFEKNALEYGQECRCLEYEKIRQNYCYRNKLKKSKKIGKYKRNVEKWERSEKS